MKLLLRDTLIYTAGFLVFPYSWLREQPHAFRAAYLDSIGSAHHLVKKLRREEGK